MKNKTSFAPRAFKGILWWFIGEIVCAIFNMCMLLIMQKFMIVKIFTGIASLIIVNGLYFNFTYNAANDDLKLCRSGRMEKDKYMGLKIALTAPLLQYIMWIMLVLSKLGVIKDIFNIYILANIQTIAFVDLFTTERTIGALSWGGALGLLGITLIAPATILLTYYCVSNDIDVKGLALYGKKDNK